MNLNPCPFCSSPKIKYSTKKSGKYKEEYYQAAFYCDDCHAYGPRVISKKFDGDYITGYYIRNDEILKAEAAKLWNQQNSVAIAINKFADNLTEIYSSKVYEPTEKQPVKHTMVTVLLDRIEELKTSIIETFNQDEDN